MTLIQLYKTALLAFMLAYGYEHLSKAVALIIGEKLFSVWFPLGEIGKLFTFVAFGLILLFA